MADSSLEYSRKRSFFGIYLLLLFLIVVVTMSNANKILTCDSGRCEFCTRGSLDTDTVFYANCTNKEYHVNFDANCQTGMCIYLISCKICNMKYVGKSWNSIRARLNGHRGHLLRGTEGQIMRDHFTGNDGHGISSIMIKPIELVPRKELITREKFWIAELNTLFPYGLNMEANFKGVQDAHKLAVSNTSNKTIYEVFNVTKSERRCKGGRKHQHNRSTIYNDILPPEQFNSSKWIAETIDCSISSPNFVHCVRSELFKLPKSSMKLVYLHSVSEINKGNTGCSKHQYVMYLFKDLSLFKLKSCLPSPPPKSYSFLVIKYANKLLEDINLNKILKSDDVLHLFPVKNCSMATPTISYSRTKSIRSKILNYKQSLLDPNYMDFKCCCHKYAEKFIDKDHKHIVTGDLNIVGNKELRSLMERGLNYHDQQPPNKDVVINVIKSGIDSYVYKASNRLSVSISQFSAWKYFIMEKVGNIVNKCKPYSFNNVLTKSGPQNALAELQRDFVMVPVDKAANNVGLICKKFYHDVMTQEIINSNTFAPTNKAEDVLYTDLKKSGYINTKDKEKLPYLYASIKMHKNPKGFRFITAGRDTILQNLSVYVSKCLKRMLQTANSSKHYRIKHIDNCVFIIDNRNKVVNFINKANQLKGGKRKSITSWDFSTLYTKIPHTQLKSNIEKFVHNIFNCLEKDNAGKKYICCSAKSKIAYYTKNRSKNNICMDKVELIKAINFIIDNSYVLFHDVVYRQVIGIPMGTNCAPFLANIYLHVFEYDYTQYLIENNHIDTAKSLSQMFRYQDDCISMNDNSVFKDHYNKIYPKEMILKNTNISRDKCSFLDLTISIYHGKFLFYSYDKRDDFDFQVVNYPNLKGNIPSLQSYGVYSSQLVRFCDINLSINNFINDVNKMTHKFLNQGFSKEKLVKKYEQFLSKFMYKWSKYNVDMFQSRYSKRVFKGC